jgi:PKD repeat protein
MPKRIVALMLLGLFGSGCSNGSSSSASLSVSCGATPTSGIIPLPVHFTASPTGGDGTYTASWSFGDGSGASNLEGDRTYTAAGSYTAVAEVRSAGQAARCSVGVSALNAPPPTLGKNSPPVAKFKTNPYPTQGKVPFTITFSACESSDPDGDQLLFRFDVGDGLYDDDHCRKEHTYRSAGRFPATICVTDNFPGHADQCQSYTVTVTP